MTGITVIGAAIAGPATALRLAQLGHDVTVYEQREENDLASAGILGITPSVWQQLQEAGVNVEARELVNGFRDYNKNVAVPSPFRLITWTGLHRALVDTGEAHGVEYVFGSKVNVAGLPGIVVDATGVAGAAKRLRSEYSGTVIYRGLSTRFVGEPFVVYRAPTGEYLTIGDTPTGAFWAMFVHREEPGVLATVEQATVPHDYREMPPEFRRIIRYTPVVQRTPISNWTIPLHMHDPSFRVFTIGDVNGPVRPVTTSGANLAVMEGFAADRLVTGDKASAYDMEVDMLRRRMFDLVLGAYLDDHPEIGGILEDPSFFRHHHALFYGGYE
jgi:hypothetical protein